MYPVLAASLLLAAIVSGNPLPPAKKCSNFAIPLSIATKNYGWNYPPFQNDSDVTDFNTALGRRDAATSFKPLSPPTEAVSAVWTISGTFCEPLGATSDTVLVTSHGGGYNGLYAWVAHGESLC